MKIVGGKLLDVCGNCGEIVRIDKPLFGSLHICTNDEERSAFRAEIAQKAADMKKRLERA